MKATIEMQICDAEGCGHMEPLESLRTTWLELTPYDHGNWGGDLWCHEKGDEGRVTLCAKHRKAVDKALAKVLAL